MNVDVVIPWQGRDPDRLRAFGTIFPKWREDWTVVVGSLPPDEPWCKARAVSHALAVSANPDSSPRDILVIADADVWTDGVGNAVREVERGASWAIPHNRVHRLTATGSQTWATGGDDPELAEVPYAGLEGGGIVVLRRSTYDDCPLDPGFVGWGHEDEAWAMALRVLHGRPRRGNAPLWHLWHEPQDRDSRRFGSAASKELLTRYRVAARRHSTMRELVDSTPRLA